MTPCRALRFAAGHTPTSTHPTQVIQYDTHTSKHPDTSELSVQRMSSDSCGPAALATPTRNSPAQEAAEQLAVQSHWLEWVSWLRIVGSHSLYLDDVALDVLGLPRSGEGDQGRGATTPLARDGASTMETRCCGGRCSNKRCGSCCATAPEELYQLSERTDGFPRSDHLQ